MKSVHTWLVCRAGRAVTLLSLHIKLIVYSADQPALLILHVIWCSLLDSSGFTNCGIICHFQSPCKHRCNINSLHGSNMLFLSPWGTKHKCIRCLIILSSCCFPTLCQNSAELNTYLRKLCWHNQTRKHTAAAGSLWLSLNHSRQQLRPLASCSSCLWRASLCCSCQPLLVMVTREYFSSYCH